MSVYTVSHTLFQIMMVNHRKLRDLCQRLKSVVNEADWYISVWERRGCRLDVDHESYIAEAPHLRTLRHKKIVRYIKHHCDEDVINVIYNFKGCLFDLRATIFGEQAVQDINKLKAELGL